MITWMEHPNHGRMPCYLPSEVEANKKHGWVEIGTGDSPVENRKKQIKEIPAIEKDTIEKDVEKEQAISDYVAKFGKRPHHKLSTKNILKAVNDNGP